MSAIHIRINPSTKSLRSLVFRSSFFSAAFFSVSCYSTLSFSFASSSLLKSGSFAKVSSSTSRSYVVRPMSSTSTAESVNASPPMNVAGEKLTRLRDLMESVGVDAYVVPTDDPHLSEYVSDAYARREYISGFQGSAGTALITSTGAWLWTDSRYYNEATLQLDSDYWTLMKAGLPKTPLIPKFLADLAVEHRKSDAGKTYRIGIDPFVHSASFAKELEDAIETAQETYVLTNTADSDSSSNVHDDSLGIIDTLDDHGNLIDILWGADRPPIPTSPFRVHPMEYAGMTIQEKVAHIRKCMTEESATLCVFPALDDVAYILNVRAKGDVECNPVGIAYCAVTQEHVTLYCNAEHKLSDASVKQYLLDAGVTICPYDDIVVDIQKHLEQKKKMARVWMDKSRCNFALVRCVPPKQLVDKQNPITPLKACKNSAELEGMRKAHIVDGVAMAHFIAWLQDAVVNQKRSVSEVEIDQVLTSFRAQQEGFFDLSFPTIAGVGSNGAIIHYRAKEGTDLMKYLDTTQPILLDSGGQYYFGTTDVTRTWHFGTATEEFKEYYTRVLKGNIGVDTMIWPEETPGFVLDVMARKALWDIQKDYGHGTGHGVGAALNVHEGPHSISPRWNNKEPLKASMIVSNEPGYYEDGRFGIRIENLLEILTVEDAVNGEAASKKQFLKFRPLTLIPIQKNLIKIEIMTEVELDWLDTYHQLVWEKLSGLLEDSSPAKDWLRTSCEKIERKR